ncbi:MAG: SurA N-terminal domain-containing protein [Pseudomonadota bacterium]
MRTFIPAPLRRHLLAMTATAALFAGSLGGATMLATVPAEAASIEALVNGQAITDYDVAQRQKMMKLTGESGTRSAVLEDLIQERLKFQEANRLGIRVDDAQVNEAFANIAQRTRLTPAQLTQALAQVGINADTLRNRIRSQIAWNNVVRQRARREARVTDQDIFAALDTRGDANREAVEYTLTQVTVLGQNAMRQASALRGRFTSCEQNLASLRGLNGVVVKDLGRRRSSELSEADRERLDNTAVGRLSNPFEADGGARMFAVCNKRDIIDQTASENEVRQELFGERVDVAARRMIMDLMQDAIIEYR